MSTPRTRTNHRWIAVVAIIALVAVAAVASFSLSAPRKVAQVDVHAPSTHDLAVTARAKVLFGHQSVGSNILAGLAAVYADDGTQAPTIVETRGEAVDGDAYIAHAHIGVNGDPAGKFAAFTELVDGAAGADVSTAVAKLCYTDVTASTDVRAVFDGYVSMMDALEARHPDIRFLYTTVPLTTDRGWKAQIKALIGRDDQMGPADNVARQQYNMLIRERYGETGRLFDVAAVEASGAPGDTERSTGGSEYFVLNGSLAADPGHLNDLGGRAVAAEFVRLIAAQQQG